MLCMVLAQAFNQQPLKQVKELVESQFSLILEPRKTVIKEELSVLEKVLLGQLVVQSKVQLTLFCSQQQVQQILHLGQEKRLDVHNQKFLQEEPNLKSLVQKTAILMRTPTQINLSNFVNSNLQTIKKNKMNQLQVFTNHFNWMKMIKII